VTWIQSENGVAVCVSEGVAIVPVCACASEDRRYEIRAVIPHGDISRTLTLGVILPPAEVPLRQHAAGVIRELVEAAASNGVASLSDLAGVRVLPPEGDDGAWGWER
jgi:hypothetical protein